MEFSRSEQQENNFSDTSENTNQESNLVESIHASSKVQALNSIQRKVNNAIAAPYPAIQLVSHKEIDDRFKRIVHENGLGNNEDTIFNIFWGSLPKSYRDLSIDDIEMYIIKAISIHNESRNAEVQSKETQPKGNPKPEKATPSDPENQTEKIKNANENKTLPKEFDPTNRAQLEDSRQKAKDIILKIDSKSEILNEYLHNDKTLSTEKKSLKRESIVEFIVLIGLISTYIKGPSAFEDTGIYSAFFAVFLALIDLYSRIVHTVSWNAPQVTRGVSRLLAYISIASMGFHASGLLVEFMMVLAICTSGAYILEGLDGLHQLQKQEDTHDGHHEKEDEESAEKIEEIKEKSLEVSKKTRVFDQLMIMSSKKEKTQREFKREMIVEFLIVVGLFTSYFEGWEAMRNINPWIVIMGAFLALIDLYSRISHAFSKDQPILHGLRISSRLATYAALAAWGFQALKGFGGTSLVVAFILSMVYILYTLDQYINISRTEKEPDQNHQDEVD